VITGNCEKHGTGVEFVEIRQSGLINKVDPRRICKLCQIEFSQAEDPMILHLIETSSHK